MSKKTTAGVQRVRDTIAADGFAIGGVSPLRHIEPLEGLLAVRLRRLYLRSLDIIFYLESVINPAREDLKRIAGGKVARFAE
jgi:hypothetical protein